MIHILEYICKIQDFIRFELNKKSFVITSLTNLIMQKVRYLLYYMARYVEEGSGYVR